MTRAAQPGMTEREHHAWGALLKYIEAIATANRYDRYPKSSKTGKKFECFLAATKALREQLNHEYSWVATEHLLPPKDYHRDHIGEKYSAAQRKDIDYWEARKAAGISSVYYGDEVDSLNFVVFHDLEDGPPKRVLKSLGIDPQAHETKKRERFQRVVEQLAIAAQGQMPKLPWEMPTDRHAPSERHSSKTQTNHRPRSSNSAAFTPIR